jgi:alpha-ketoglutarate-dependent taurine dioxygenase
VDLTRPLSDAGRDQIKAAILTYKVVFFRDQFLDQDQHAAFARHFGPLYTPPAAPRPPPRPPPPAPRPPPGRPPAAPRPPPGRMDVATMSSWQRGCHIHAGRLDPG